MSHGAFMLPGMPEPATVRVSVAEATAAGPEGVGSYRLLRKLGEGGMGVVHLAEHVVIGRKAAIKVLRRECCANPIAVERFVAEARATAQVSHPGVVDVLDFGRQPDGSAFLVMEYLRGQSLAALLGHARAVPTDMLLEIGRQTALALAATHGAGVIHRDLKPENVFLVPDEEMPCSVRVKLLDFGIAKLLGDEMRAQLTRTGAILGTPSYMSPEQCRGARDVDHRTDVYALGCVLFAMAAGRPPFVGDGYGDVMAGHMRDQPPPLASLAPSLPPVVVQLVERMLAKDPAARPASMREIARTLEHARKHAAAAFQPVARPANPTQLYAIAPTPLPANMRERTRPTTLGDSAVEITPRGRLRRASWLGAIALALVFGVVLGRLLTGADDGEAAATIAGAGSPTAHIAAATPPTSIRHTIASAPTGADVYRAQDGAYLGATPVVDIASRTSGATEYVLRMPGYDESRVRLDAGEDARADVSLRRARRAP